MKLKNLILLAIIIISVSCDDSEDVPFEINELTGDYNGDGYEDEISVAISYEHYSNVTVHLNDQSGGFNSFVWLVTNQWGHPGLLVVGDFDGDGDDDILSPDGRQLHLKTSFGEGFSSHTFTAPGKYSTRPAWAFACDYNGDGVDELITIENEKIYIIESNLTNGEIDNFTSHNHLTLDQWSTNPADTWIEDINGDGKDEIITKIEDQLFVREWDGLNFLLREMD